MTRCGHPTVIPQLRTLGAGRRVTLHIEDIQHWALRCDFARAPGHGLRQQALKLFQIIQLGPDIFKMMCRDLADLSARSLFRSSKPHEGTDFTK